MDKLSKLKQLLRPAKGLIFDFDGLLADSEKYHFRAYNDVFVRYGHTLDETEYYKYWTSLGHGVRGEIERHNLDLDPLEIRREKMPIFSKYCEDGSITLFEEAREIIDMMSRFGKAMAIASGTPAPDVRAVLRNANVDDFFDVIIGSDTVARVKPEPDIFLAALKALRFGPNECVVFEDAEKGMFAAIEAKIPVVIIRSPETKRFNFGRADLTVDSHREMIALLREIETN